MNIVGLQVSSNVHPLATSRGIITKRGQYYGVQASLPLSTPPVSSSPSPPRRSPPHPTPPPSQSPQPAIIKFFATPTPSDEQVLRMRYEYMAFQRKTAHGPLAIRELGATYPIALCSDPELNFALVYDDIGGGTLDMVQYDSESSGVRLLSNKSLMSLEEMVLSLLFPALPCPTPSLSPISLAITNRR